MANRKYLIWLLWGVILAASLAGGYSAMADRGGDIEEPIYKITFKVAPEARNEFLSRIEAFADKNAFAIRSAPTRPDSNSSLIQLWREDIKILGVNPFDPNIYRFRFYSNDDMPIKPQVLNHLTNEIQGVTNKLEGAGFEEK